MEKLTAIATEINEAMAGKFPHFHCVATGGICDSIYIELSLTPREKWPYGQIQNTLHVKTHIFTNGRAFDFTGDKALKLRAKKGETSPQKMAAYVIKQLEKLVP